MKIRFLKTVKLPVHLTNDSDATVDVEFEQGWQVSAEVTPGLEGKSKLAFDDGSHSENVDNSLWEKVDAET